VFQDINPSDIDRPLIPFDENTGSIDIRFLMWASAGLDKYIQLY